MTKIQKAGSDKSVEILFFFWCEISSGTFNKRHFKGQLKRNYFKTEFGNVPHNIALRYFLLDLYHGPLRFAKISAWSDSAWINHQIKHDHNNY